MAATAGLLPVLGLLPAPAEAATASTVVSGTIEQVFVDPPQEFAPAGTGRPSSPTLQTFVHAPGRLVRLPDALARGRHPHESVTVTLQQGRVAAISTGAGSLAATVGAGVAASASATPKLVPPAPATGEHSLVVLPVYWSTPGTETVASLAALAQQTTRFWSQQSGGSIRITASVRPWTRIADPGACNADLIAGRALTAAGVAWPTSPRQHVVFYFPQRADCGWAGLGSVGGSFIWDNGYPLTDVVAHELGHNLGLGHANAADCTTAGGAPVPLSATCTVTEYQDGADVMGYASYAATGSLNTALADTLGLVRTVTADPHATTTVELAPLTDAAGLRAVKIPVTNGTVYVDFRPAVGRDVRQPGWAGVQVHLRPNGGIPTSQLLDLQPELGSRIHPQLSPHLVWVVPGAGLSVVVDAVGTTATVSVTPTAGDTTAPTPAAATATLTTSPSGIASVAVTWTPSNDDGTGVAAYTVHAGATLLGRAGPTDTSLTAVLADPGATVRVDAEDAAGNVTTGSAVTPVDAGVGPEPPTAASGGGSTTPTDTTPPGAPTITRPTATVAQRTHEAVLSWRGATDPDSGVAGYQVTANGTVLGVVATTSVTVTGLREGRTVLAVTAVNGAGLVGQARSATILVDTLTPKAPPRLTLRKGTLSWAAPIDTGTALRYQVFRDGLLVATVGGHSSAVSVRPGRHVWTVRCVDAVGHLSPVSRLTVTRTGTIVTVVSG